MYLALDETTGEQVALKLVQTERLTERAVADLESEPRTFASLHHPQITTA